MNKVIIVIIGSVVVLGVGVGIFVMQNNTSNKNTTTSSSAKINSQPKEPMAEENNKIEAKTVGVYKPYTAEAVATDNGKKILFFHAPWCPQCQELDKDIQNNISKANGVTIYKVDYDSNQDLRKKYGVTLQTTLVTVDDSGQLVKKYVAYNEPTYANIAANLL